MWGHQFSGPLLLLASLSMCRADAVVGSRSPSRDRGFARDLGTPPAFGNGLGFATDLGVPPSFGSSLVAPTLGFSEERRIANERLRLRGFGSVEKLIHLSTLPDRTVSSAQPLDFANLLGGVRKFQWSLLMMIGLSAAAATVIKTSVARSKQLEESNPYVLLAAGTNSKDGLSKGLSVADMGDVFKARRLLAEDRHQDEAGYKRVQHVVV